MAALLVQTHTAPHEQTHTVVMSLLCWGPYRNVSYGRVYGLDPTEYQREMGEENVIRRGRIPVCGRERGSHLRLQDPVYRVVIEYGSPRRRLVATPRQTKADEGIRLKAVSRGCGKPPSIIFLVRHSALRG